MTYGRNLSLFPRKTMYAITNRLKKSAPKLGICPVCKAVYRLGGGNPSGCSSPCRVYALFWKHVEQTETCWIWRGDTSGNYGKFFESKSNKRFLAHRVSYEIHIGPIPDGLTIDHLCRNTLCVRPDHLETVTMRENLLRGNSWSGRNARKTHCPRGHLYDEANTYRDKTGGRTCRICSRVLQRERKRLARGLSHGNDPETSISHD